MTRTMEAKLNLMHKFQETAKIKQKVTNSKTSLRHELDRTKQGPQRQDNGDQIGTRRQKDKVNYKQTRNSGYTTWQMKATY